MPMLHLAVRFFAPVFALIILSACATQPLPSGKTAYIVDRGLDYRLGPGDKVRITVFGENALSGEFIVANNGAIAVPLVGEVKAGGLTTTSFQTSLAEHLAASGLVLSPKVSADVITYRPYYILGEVAHPGQYPYAVGMTVTKAIATAGGFTYRANNKLIYVTREGQTNEDMLAVTAASWIGPGDTIRVAERYF